MNGFHIIEQVENIDSDQPTRSEPDALNNRVSYAKLVHLRAKSAS